MNKLDTQKARQHRENRAMLMDPNRYSSLKVERFTFGLLTDVILGEKKEFDVELKLTHQMMKTVTAFRPQRITSNVMAAGIVLLQRVLVHNVDVVYGHGVDAWQFNPNAVGEHLDVPRLELGDTVRMVGTYTGRVPYYPMERVNETPIPYKPGEVFAFSLAFTGPSAIDLE